MAAVSDTQYVRNEFDKHFPRIDYPTVKKEGKHVIFHFLLSLDQPDSVILEWYRTCISTDKYRKFINSLDDTGQLYYGPNGNMTLRATGLTPLSLSILLGRKTIVRALCDHPETNMEAVDRANWTPLQHAIARNDPEILDVVEQATDAFNKTAGKVSLAAKQRFPFLREVVRGVRLDPDQEIGHFQNEVGEMRILTQKEFVQMSGGAQFHDGLFGSPNSIFRNWYRAEGAYDFMNEMMSRKFAAFLHQRPQLFLTSDPVGNFGVHAQSKIRQKEIATFWGSELTPPDAGKGENLMTTGKRVCNFGALIRDGFPNVAEFRARIDGIEFSALVALREIEPGSELFVMYDYSHPSKWGSRTDYTLRQVKAAFPKPTSPERVWKSLKNLDQETMNPEIELDIQCQKAGLLYLFHTPSVLLSLIMRGHFDLNSIQRLLNDEKFLKGMDFPNDDWEKFVSIYRQALDTVQNFLKAAPESKRELVAIRLESNLRAGLLAIQMLLRQKPMDWEAFDRFCYASEALYALLEERGDRELSLRVVGRLSPEERRALLQLSNLGNIPLYLKSAEDFRKIEETILQ